jgi:hypothetical protein
MKIENTTLEKFKEIKKMVLASAAGKVEKPLKLDIGDMEVKALESSSKDT